MSFLFNNCGDPKLDAAFLLRLDLAFRHTSGLLTDDQFATKKAELISILDSEQRDHIAEAF